MAKALVKLAQKQIENVESEMAKVQKQLDKLSQILVELSNLKTLFLKYVKYEDE